MAPAPFGDCLPTLDTPRLQLRMPDDRDVPALLEVFGDEEALRYWSHPPLADLEAARGYLASIREGAADGTLFQWAITRSDEDRLLGTCTLAGWDRLHRRIEIGFILGREHWGKGYASEAVRGVLRYGFTVMDLYRVEADVDPENVASIRLLERLGFRREALLRDRYWMFGFPQHAVIYALLRSEAEPNLLGPLA